MLPVIFPCLHQASATQDALTNRCHLLGSPPNSCKTNNSRMNLQQLFRLTTRVSGVTSAITILMTKNILYFNGLFILVVAVWLWGEYDWHMERKSK